MNKRPFSDYVMQALNIVLAIVSVIFIILGFTQNTALLSIGFVLLVTSIIGQVALTMSYKQGIGLR